MNNPLPQHLQRDDLIEDASDAVRQACSRAKDALVSENVHEAMNRLSDDLLDIRERVDRRTWRELAKQARSHPVANLIWEDPFTKRSYSKPRGYPGDAVLVDFIYRISTSHPIGSRLGEKIFTRNIKTDEPCAVRERKRIVARFIDSACRNDAPLRIFSVACGHLREVEETHLYRQGGGHAGMATVVALDQDQQSLEEVDRSYRHIGVETVPASVRSLVEDDLNIGSFDCIYGAGIFDYLTDSVSTRLMRSLWRMLKPDGKLLIPNFAPGISGAAYMETFMDWWLIYRDKDDLNRLAELARLDGVAEQKVWPDSRGSILYLELRKES